MDQTLFKTLQENHYLCILLKETYRYQLVIIDAYCNWAFCALEIKWFDVNKIKACKVNWLSWHNLCSFWPGSKEPYRELHITIDCDTASWYRMDSVSGQCCYRCCVPQNVEWLPVTILTGSKEVESLSLFINLCTWKIK